MTDSGSILTANFFRYKKPDGRPTGMVLGMTEDSENNVWAEVIGPPQALLRIRDSRVEETLELPQVPSADKVAADPISGIWLGLQNGNIARYRNHHWRRSSLKAVTKALGSPRLP